MVGSRRKARTLIILWPQGKTTGRRLAGRCSSIGKAGRQERRRLDLSRHVRASNLSTHCRVWGSPIEPITRPATTVIPSATESVQQTPASARNGGSGANDSQDAVDLTETGNRGVMLPNQAIHAQNQIFASQFPEVSAGSPSPPGSRSNGPLSSPSTASGNAGGTLSTVGGGSSATGTAPSPVPSAAAEERLQRLNQVLENLGINPEQITYSDLQSAGLLPAAEQNGNASLNRRTSGPGQSNAGNNGFAVSQTSKSATSALNASRANPANTPCSFTGQRINISA